MGVKRGGKGVERGEEWGKAEGVKGGKRCHESRRSGAGAPACPHLRAASPTSFRSASAASFATPKGTSSGASSASSSEEEVGLGSAVGALRLPAAAAFAFCRRAMAAAPAPPAPELLPPSAGERRAPDTALPPAPPRGMRAHTQHSGGGSRRRPFIAPSPAAASGPPAPRCTRRAGPLPALRR